MCWEYYGRVWNILEHSRTLTNNVECPKTMRTIQSLFDMGTYLEEYIKQGPSKVLTSVSYP